MAMDFFESQDRARKKTGRLVVFFGLAVVCILVLTYTAVALVVIWYGGGDALLDPILLLAVGGIVLGVVGLSSLYKIAELRGGGRVVAESLGGQLVDRSTADRHERRVLNVVEEMAIASGTPVPPVYLMREEAGINAFAAGYSPHDAVIGVTRGTVELLNRDELQGVIAHEFSHILNGDMRLNIRLIGLLHGILIIGLAGTMVMRAMFYAPRVSSRRRGNETLPLIALGLGLMAIGGIGVFFGRLIKAAVSRQREFLADASAVQFTRNPPGIAGALKKIGASVFGSKIQSPRAEEASHMFFGQAMTSAFDALYATHPPLPERIRRIEPNWDGEFPVLEEKKKRRREKRRDAKRAALDALLPGARLPDLAGIVVGAEAADAAAAAAVPAAVTAAAVTTIGRPSAAHVAYARSLVASLPDPLKEATRDSFTARAVVYALLLDENATVRANQVEHLERAAEPGMAAETGRLAPLVASSDLHARLPLLDLALPALHELSHDQYQDFKKTLRALILADEQVDLFEGVLQQIILRHLEPQFTSARPRAVHYYNLRGVRDECARLLSTLAYVGHRDQPSVQKAFTDGVSRLQQPGLVMLPPQACDLPSLDAALAKLDRVTPRMKRNVIEACAACIVSDREVTVREGELLRAIADALDCPMPPLLPGQPLI
ncbi:MAG: M48 family metallopeptidase [Planctomycetota bacterium]|jgi:Zn-dependent protease with chaperone function